MLKEELDKRADLQSQLFRRGFIVSSKSLDDKQGAFPFYNNFKNAELDGMHIYVHNTLNIHTAKCENVSMFLCGHCYNPFTMEHEEEKQLQRIGNSFGKADFWEKIS